MVNLLQKKISFQGVMKILAKHFKYVEEKEKLKNDIILEKKSYKKEKDSE